MTITAGPKVALENRTLTLCAAYVTQHGNDLETADYYRLQADLWDAAGKLPNEGSLDELLGFIWTEAQVDAGDRLPGGWPVSHPEHGPAVSDWKARNAEDIGAAMVGLFGSAW